MRITLFILGAVFLITFISGSYIFLVGCVRRKELPWLNEGELLKTPAGKYFEYISGSEQWLKSHNAEDIYITSNDGLRLHGLWVPTDDALGTVILAHGYRSSYLLDFCAAFPLYRKLGMNLLIPDQRSHGNSEGTYITFGIKESDDMICWLDWHNKSHSKIPVLFCGISMGASTVLYLADRILPENVRGIVADCGFTSPYEIITEVFHRVIHLPVIPSIWFTDLLARFFAGFALREKDTRETLKNSRYPILLVHGTEDAFVPCEMTKEAFAVCCGPKHQLLVDGADHGISFLIDTKGYTDAVIEFTEKYVFEWRKDNEYNSRKKVE